MIRRVRCVEGLLARVEREPSAEAWRDLDHALIAEGECFERAGFAALPRLAALAAGGSEEALQIAGLITATLHRYHDADDLVEDAAEALGTLRRLAAETLAGRTGPAFRARLGAALAFGGYAFWAVISYDFEDEHYEVGCPGCAQRLWVVIGDYGCYAAVRHFNDGDVERTPLRAVTPGHLSGIARWMYDAAFASGEVMLAWGLTHLFGDAECPRCGSIFNVAEWYEAENGPPQPIFPI
jgi:hypothetical protein